MRKKFKLTEEAEISFEDEEGGDVDEDVLPFLLDQDKTTNLLFLVKGEGTSSTFVNVNTPSSLSQAFPTGNC